MDTEDSSPSLAHGATNQTPPVLPKASPAIPAWRAYVHLYLPLVTGLLYALFWPTLMYRQDAMLFLAASALFTYPVGSLIYPENRPRPSPEESIRFTRKHYLFRAAVLFTYGRLFGTPFNAKFFVMDLMWSYLVVPNVLIGERAAGQPQRRSEFLIAALWAGASHLVLLCDSYVPGNWLWVVFRLDRALWRAMYLGLVDDVVGVLAYARVRSLAQRLLVLVVQAFVVTFVVVVLWVRVNAKATGLYDSVGFREGVEREFGVKAS